MERKTFIFQEQTPRFQEILYIQSRTIQLQVFHQQNFIWMWADFFSLHFSSHPPGYPLISYIL